MTITRLLMKWSAILLTLGLIIWLDARAQQFELVAGTRPNPPLIFGADVLVRAP